MYSLELIRSRVLIFKRIEKGESIMNMPGFTATTSLYNAHAHYLGDRNLAKSEDYVGVLASEVIPSYSVVASRPGETCVCRMHCYAGRCATICICHAQ
jgi:hypothetical protein